MTSAADTSELAAFAPSPEFTATANAGPDLQAAADEDRLAFWAKQAERPPLAFSLNDVDWFMTEFTAVMKELA
ncbi:MULTISPECIES: hypothetical protein [Rhodococcus]|uniref:hypothetical protein n=1 Tax=Rhodococcus TaxID=1827 RepID=UPI002285EA69|nr:hypothetical protein [Rhodococcus sp. JS3073]WAM19580.1 hypothetical protein OYT95_38575 [Rhodococcus sp. JS3073]